MLYNTGFRDQIIINRTLFPVQKGKNIIFKNTFYIEYYEIKL